MKKTAYTLIEMIMIIATVVIVAILVIPTSYNGSSDKTIVKKLQDTQTALDLSFKKGLEKYNGKPKEGMTWSQLLLEQMPIKKDCGIGSDECIPDLAHADLFRSEAKNLHTVILKNGTRLAVQLPYIFVFFDEKDKRYVAGRNEFLFWPDNDNTIVPILYRDTHATQFQNDCKNNAQPLSCTGWAFYKQNRDYLRCSTKLDWNRKTTCK